MTRGVSCAVAVFLFSNLFAAPPVDSESQAQSFILERFPYETTVPLKIVGPAIPANPFTVVGPRGAILGAQDGSFEAWVFPWKVFSNLRIHAEVENYPVPIDVNEQAASIDVRPDHTMITFSHAIFTVRALRHSLRSNRCVRSP